MNANIKRRKPATPQHEVRVIRNTQRTEVRKNADGSRTAVGYFATYGTVSHNLGFREVIAPGAFDASLRSNPVSCFRDHNAEMLLGRTESGTLQVSSDSIGLRFSVNLPKGVSYSDDLVILLERGDAFENSFAFAVDGPDGDTWTEQPDGSYLRTLKKVILYEGSILTGNPAAYPGTSVDLRSCPIAIRAKLKRSSDDECEDGQHYDADLDDCVDNDADDTGDDDDETEWSNRSAAFRCAWRCLSCRSAHSNTGIQEDDPSARSKRQKQPTKTQLSRCAEQCQECRDSSHYTWKDFSGFADDSSKRAHRHLLSLL
jgi:hypothetical protein